MEQTVLPTDDSIAIPVQRAIPLDSPLEWNRALAGVRHGFFHTWEHSYAMFLTTGQPTFLFCAETPESKVICPFVERRFGDYVDVATPYGFSGFAGNGALSGFHSIWTRFAQDRGYISGFVSFHPLFACADTANSEFVHEEKTLFLLNLMKSKADLFRNFSKTLRQELKKWQRGIFVSTDRARLTAFALENFREFFRRRNATPEYNLNPRTLEFLMNLENVVVLGVGTGTEIEAVIIAGLTPHSAEAIFTFTASGVSGHGAGVVWKLAENIQERGIPYLNLGGGRVPNDNLAFFKSRFGSEHHPLHILKEVYAAESYEKLCLLAGVDPGDRKGYFPGYRKSQFAAALDTQVP